MTGIIEIKQQTEVFIKLENGKRTSFKAEQLVTSDTPRVGDSVEICPLEGDKFKLVLVA